MYIGKTDVLATCKDPACRKARWCLDPLLCTQFAHGLTLAWRAVRSAAKLQAQDREARRVGKFFAGVSAIQHHLRWFLAGDAHQDRDGEVFLGIKPRNPDDYEVVEYIIREDDVLTVTRTLTIR